MSTFSRRARRVRGGLCLLGLLFLLGEAPPLLAQDAAPDTLAVPVVQKNALVALGEITLVNTLVWSYDRYIRAGGGEGFKIGWNAWWNNIENGFEYDDNNFSTNQFAHPYHGNLYFNAARSNGFTYWESIPFAFAGSFQWEYFGESHNPAINDWIATSVGGAGLGEIFHRFSNMIWDNRATGSGRVWRELGGTLVNPVGGFNRIISGQATRVAANPPNRLPGSMEGNLDVGLRVVGEERLWESDTTNVFLQFDYLHGSPFEGDLEHPFDTFNFSGQLNFGTSASTMGRIQARGILHGAPVHETESTKHLVTFSQYFDYVNNTAYVFGGQSVGTGFLSRFSRGQHQVVTSMELGVLLLGATSSDYANFTGRPYDFGMGGMARFSAQLRRKGRAVFTLGHTSVLLETLNGTESTHHVHATSARLELPVGQFLGAGAEYTRYHRDSQYDQFPDTHIKFPQFRAFLSWHVAD